MTALEIVKHDKFKKLVTKRWTVNFIMLAVLFVLYYGYVFTIALNKKLMVTYVTENVTFGIFFGVFVIFGAWLLTVIYVIWSNKVYDKDVNELKDMIS